MSCTPVVTLVVSVLRALVSSIMLVAVAVGSMLFSDQRRFLPSLLSHTILTVLLTSSISKLTSCLCEHGSSIGIHLYAIL